RRHTRSLRDWSSDVCSSDLKLSAWAPPINLPLTPSEPPSGGSGKDTSHYEPGPGVERIEDREEGPSIASYKASRPATSANVPPQIGRASCRERVEIAVVDVS